LVIGSAQAGLGYLTLNEHLKAQAVKGSDSTAHELHRARRDDLLWWTAGVWAFSMADAYVSAHMYRFRAQQSLSFGLSPKGLMISYHW
jgi:hypothetical protein